MQKDTVYEKLKQTTQLTKHQQKKQETLAMEAVKNLPRLIP